MSREDTAGTAASTTCPSCAAVLVVDPRFPVWCPGCDWNVDPDPPEQESGRLARWQRRIGDRMVTALHEQLCREPASRPGWDLARIATYLLAAMVHAVTLTILVLGVWLCATASPVPVVLGLVTLSVAVLLRPRFGRLGRDADVLDRTDAPHLYALLDAVATAVGARPVHRVVVDENFNASYGTVGLRRRPVVTLGAPLWSVLTAQQRVALLGHELGHGANGDARQGLMVGTALQALAHWHYLMRPARSTTVGWGDPLAMTAGLLIRLPQTVLALAVHGLRVLFWRLDLRATQRAEYLADALACRAAGRQAAAATLATLVMQESLRLAAQRAALTDRDADLFAAMRRQVRELPESERQRQLRRAGRRGHRVDTAHPPTTLRIGYVHTRADRPAGVTLDDASSAAIDTELAPLLRRANRAYGDLIRTGRFY